MIPRSIAIVGAGPRGISITERIAAHLRANPGSEPVTLHIIDDAQIGAGRVWDTRQTHTLCMNTLAGAVTLFTEPGASVTGPVFEGPTMYEWIDAMRDAPLPGYEDEIRATRPESNPSRALYGEYLRWVWQIALQQLPPSVELVEHQARVVGIRQAEGYDELELDDGTVIPAHATALATGWVLPKLPDVDAPGVTAVAAGNPVEQNVDALAPGQTVLVRGLGMGFFDLMALTTINRGGRFIEDASSPAGLRYEASGEEPNLVVTSGRGYPYLPKSEYKSLPPTANLERLRAAIEASASTEPVSFAHDLWPALARDAYAEYYRTLARVRPDALHWSLEEILTTIDGADLAAELAAAATPDSILPIAAALTAVLNGATDEPFDMGYWVDPLAGTDELDADALTERIAAGMARDIAEAVAAWDSPLKAGLWAISAARKPVAIAVENGRGPREPALSQYLAFGQMVGSGPPLFRTRELLALVEVGLATFLGPSPVVTVENGTADDGTVSATSGSRTVTVAAITDAFLPGPDVRRAADPLTQTLLDAGRVRPFAPYGTPTAAPETDEATRRTVHPDGTLDTRLHITGIPTGAQWADTTISPMPGTDPRMLQETDKTALSLLVQAGVIPTR